MAFLWLVLYCEKKYGTGKELADFSAYRLPPPPIWAQTGVMYQVFPRVFTPEGTFRAMMGKLDYIENLEIDIIWIMPIFPIGEKDRKGQKGSPYAVRDFRAIHPELGTEEDFRELVEEIHTRGMKVILDMVLNHAANDNPLIQEHPDWFLQDEKGNFTRENADWSDITDFNYENPRMREYMIETLIYWITRFGIDGFRCDVAGLVPLDFWQEAIPRLREVKSELYLLAEWEDPKILLSGFNSDYDWTLYYLFKDIRKGKKRTMEVVNYITERDRLYPQNALPLRFLENHDEQRSLREFGAQAIEAYATFLFTLPGIPLIYAGQEFGDPGEPEILKYEPYTLQWISADSSLLSLYRSLIKLRKENSCFTGGNFIPLQVACLAGSVGAFLREDETSAALIVTNLQDRMAKKVILTMPDELRNRLKNYQFGNYRNRRETISPEEIYFEQIFPFETIVYLANKSSNDSVF
ncbi:MAG: hypothetical protein Kow0042_09390 [Calditrichia bacterium]